MNKHLPGLTLIELVVVTALGISVLTLSTYIGISGTQSFTRINSNQEQNASFLQVFNQVDRNVRTAIEFPNTYRHSTTSQDYNVNDGKTLIMKQYVIKNDIGQVDCTIFDYIIYTLDTQGNLREVVDPHANSKREKHDLVLFSNVSRLSFVQAKGNANTHRQVTMSMDAILPPPAQTTLTRQQTMVARND